VLPADVEPSVALQLAFHRARGIVAMRMHETQQGETELKRALSLAEEALKTVRSARERANWKKEAGPVYRQLVRFTLDEDRDPEAALALWERYPQRAG
jgi:hypothetical protein